MLGCVLTVCYQGTGITTVAQCTMARVDNILGLL